MDNDNVDMTDEELARELEKLEATKVPEVDAKEIAEAVVSTEKVSLWDKIKTAIAKVWRRLTASRVTWMAVPAAIAQLWLALSGNDISGQLTAVFTALWLFLSLNNPEDQQSF